MRVADLMTPDPLRVSDGASLAAASTLLALGDVRHLPVVDDVGRVVGMVSERDILGLVTLREGETDDPLAPTDDESTRVAFEALEARLERPVREVMSPHAICIAPDASARELVDLLLEHKFGALPVVEEGQLVGIVSYVDVLRQVRDLL